jgi:hypothetical protein
LVDRLYIAWQDESRSWHTIGLLTRVPESGYEFVFTEGVLALPSVLSAPFPLEPGQTYRFNDLIPILRNRLPSKSRADFMKMAGWLGLRGDEDDYTLLTRFGLIPGTDSFLIYPEPRVLVSGQYDLEFFVHGIRHMHPAAAEWCEKASAGDRLLPLLDVQNTHDQNAVALRPADECFLIGYVPAFYSTDFRKLLSCEKCAAKARITVARNNRDAPAQLRLVCKISSPIPVNFTPLNTANHRPLQTAQPPHLRAASV